MARRMDKPLAAALLVAACCAALLGEGAAGASARRTPPRPHARRPCPCPPPAACAPRSCARRPRATTPSPPSPLPPAGAAAGRDLPNLDVSPYGAPGAAREAKLSAAVKCMTAVRTRLLGPGPLGLPPPFRIDANVANCLRSVAPTCGFFVGRGGASGPLAAVPPPAPADRGLPAAPEPRRRPPRAACRSLNPIALSAPHSPAPPPPGTPSTTAPSTSTRPTARPAAATARCG
jgi:hypothetical protein